MMKHVYLTLFLFLSAVTATAQHIIRVAPDKDDMTAELQDAIEQAKNYQGKPVVIELQNATYHLYRSSSSHQLYHISNTTSEQENPDQTKHIGLWLKGLKNVTIDGKGARLVTHGEMTSFVVDACEHIRLQNLTITAADPTVPEMTVCDVGERHMTVRIHPQSQYRIDEGKFAFVGDSWTLSTGIAQSYDPQQDITWRSWSPLSGLRKAIELEPHLLRLVYDTPPQARPGMVFQMRDGYRDEACGLIQYSKDVCLEHIHLAFLGNFGLVGQASEDITYRRLTFGPEPESGRTCAGFADFVQMSGCKGRILIEDSHFSGAHDDPINIHGTHLSVTEFISPEQVVVRYMHPQTYGFQSFFPGNTIEFIDPHSLLPLASFRVKKAVMRNEREIVLTLHRPVSPEISQRQELVVENVTYTPEVTIRNNYFSRVPTRGILVTTRRKVLIENNTFFRMQMSAVLIADDARSWFESGMARDVTIRHNRFIECGEPVIFVAPENDHNQGYVHCNIDIDHNTFLLNGTGAVSAKSVQGLQIRNNLFRMSHPATVEELVRTQECEGVTLQGNRVELR